MAGKGSEIVVILKQGKSREENESAGIRIFY